MCSPDLNQFLALWTLSLRKGRDSKEPEVLEKKKKSGYKVTFQKDKKPGRLLVRKLKGWKLDCWAPVTSLTQNTHSQQGTC